MKIDAAKFVLALESKIDASNLNWLLEEDPTQASIYAAQSRVLQSIRDCVRQAAVFDKEPKACGFRCVGIED